MAVSQKIVGENALTLFWNAINTKLNLKINKNGDNMTGALTLKGIKLTSGVDYGNSLPTSGMTTGQLFLKKVE